MKRWFTLALSTAVMITLAGAGAVKGTHVPSGNTGYVGSDQAGVYGTSTSVGVKGVGNTGVRGNGDSYGVFGDGSLYGLYGISATYGVYGVAASIGVFGSGSTGVFGTGSKGVYGLASGFGGVGVYGEDPSDCPPGQLCTITAAVWGKGTGDGAGVIAQSVDGTALLAWAGSTGLAAAFDGDVSVVGTLSKSAGSFKIDHPLDPENKYLSHSFVESPDMKNVYDGIAVLDHRGEAVVVLPEWLEALNRDFRYQLTCLGQHAPVYIAEEIKDNQFRIAGGYADMRVSWQVTGIRKDAYAVARPIPVEEPKPPQERGLYLHPEAYGLSPDLGVDARRRAQVKRER